MVQKFKFNKNTATNTISIDFMGRFDQQDVKAFIDEYNKTIRNIDTTTYDLDLDCTKLEVATPEIASQLEYCYDLYKRDGFKIVKFRAGNNGILKLQLGRRAKHIGLRHEFIA